MAGDLPHAKDQALDPQTEAPPILFPELMQPPVQRTIESATHSVAGITIPSSSYIKDDPAVASASIIYQLADAAKSGGTRNLDPQIKQALVDCINAADAYPSPNNYAPTAVPVQEITRSRLIQAYAFANNRAQLLNFKEEAIDALKYVFTPKQGEVAVSHWTDSLLNEGVNAATLEKAGISVKDIPEIKAATDTIKLPAPDSVVDDPVEASSSVSHQLWSKMKWGGDRVLDPKVEQVLIDCVRAAAIAPNTYKHFESKDEPSAYLIRAYAQASNGAALPNFRNETIAAIKHLLTPKSSSDEDARTVAHWADSFLWWGISSEALAKAGITAKDIAPIKWPDQFSKAWKL